MMKLLKAQLVLIALLFILLRGVYWVLIQWLGTRLQPGGADYSASNQPISRQLLVRAWSQRQHP